MNENERKRTKMKKNDAFLKKMFKSPLLWSIAVSDSIFPREEYQEIAHFIAKQLPTKIRHLGIAKVRHDANTWFKLGLKTQNPIQKEKISKDERRLRRFFDDADIHTFVMENAINGYNQGIDFSSNFGRKLNHFEIDGPSHFNYRVNPTRNEQMNPPYNGGTIFRSALLKQADTSASIIRVPFPVTDLILNNGKVTNLPSKIRQRIAKSILLQTNTHTQTDVFKATATLQEQKLRIGIAPVLAH